MQMHTSDVEGITDPQRVCATPPSDDWPFGRYDAVLISNGIEPGPGLGGIILHLIYCQDSQCCLKGMTSHRLD